MRTSVSTLTSTQKLGKNKELQTAAFIFKELRAFLPWDKNDINFLVKYEWLRLALISDRKLLFSQQYTECYWDAIPIIGEVKIKLHCAENK